MIDLSELLADPDFMTTFEVVKQTEPVWQEGVMTATETSATVTGIVLPSSSKDVEQLPEGDRQDGLKTFFTNETTLETSTTEKTSDVCVWKGKRYKLIHTFDYSANGFYKAIGTLVDEEEAST